MASFTVNLHAKGSIRLKQFGSRSFLKPDAMNAQLNASFEAARAVTRRNAASFYFCSRALPRDRRQAAYAIYAFCRHVDDAIDHAKTDEERYAARQTLEEDLPEIFAGRAIGQEAAWIPSFAETVEAYRIPRQYFEDLIHGVCLDAQPRVRIQTWMELREYTYYVAGVVGLIMARIFDLKDERGEEAAVCLGVAMQLTNICRDVGEDLRNNRIYLPLSELREFGVSEEDLLAGRVTAEYQNLMAFQLDRARTYYARAEEGIPLLGSPSGRFCVWLMRYVYAGIHGRIERLKYDNLHRRASTSAVDKLLLSLRAIGNSLRPRPLDPDFFRHSGVELSHAP